MRSTSLGVSVYIYGAQSNPVCMSVIDVLGKAAFKDQGGSGRIGDDLNNATAARDTHFWVSGDLFTA